MTSINLFKDIISKYSYIRGYDLNIWIWEGDTIYSITDGDNQDGTSLYFQDSWLHIYHSYKDHIRKHCEKHFQNTF
jgi:hypothetical protein